MSVAREGQRGEAAFALVDDQRAAGGRRSKGPTAFTGDTARAVNLTWTLAFLGSVTISMGLLELAARSIPMGTAYAVWGGIGAVGTVLVGMAWFGEPATSVRMLLILAIVAAIAALRITG